MILVTGGTSTVGRYLQNFLPDALYTGSKDLDLLKKDDIDFFFKTHKNIDTVIHLAAHVGSIQDNILHPVDYYEKNVLMNTQILQACHKYNVKNVISIASSCVYPDVVEKYPMDEDMLFMGPPTETSFSYGYAKRCLFVHTEAYKKQYGKNWCVLFPCNLYSEYELNNDKTHFLGRFIHRMVECRTKNTNEILLWGDGSSYRQFMFAEDLAKLIFYMVRDNVYQSMNIAPEYNYTIGEIAEIAMKCTGNNNFKIIFDMSKPNGQYRKDVSNLKMLSFYPDFKFTSLEDGIIKVYNKFMKDGCVK